nr:LOW QUALITY PROTEIN: A-kinase anchor protein 17A-like [Rhipicephalus microplus]
MSSIQTCRDTSDAVELCAPLGLYLKAIARLNVSIQLPQMKTPGRSISSWEVMEKLRQTIKPDEFTTLKISKTTLDFIRFEGEVENRGALKAVVARLDSSTVKLSGFPENLRVRAAEAKVPFPTRHDWDSYFRDAKGMDEMKPGERPDTIYVQGLPCKWFADKRRDADRPSEQLVCQAFGGPGLVRRLDIPLLDPYQKDAETSVGRISTFSFSQELTFDVYVQYMEYMGFVKAMDSLRGMKLMLKTPEGRAFTANIKVDFDRSRHLSEESIQRRQQERLKIEALEREREERVLRERLEEEQMREAERRRQREEEEQRERRREEKQRRREERKRREEEEEARKRKEEEDAKRKKEEASRKKKEEEEAMKKKEDESKKRRDEEESMKRYQEELRNKWEEEEARRKREEEMRRKKEEIRKEEESLRRKKVEAELKRHKSSDRKRSGERKKSKRKRRNKEGKLFVRRR